MRGKKRIGLLFLLIAVVVGGGGLLLAQKALHKTSDTAFCLSCHSMSKPFEEYQGTVGSDSNLLIVFYVQIMPDDLVMQLHRF
uniref:NapC/NirT family cytochrome c n=1 Tax=Escherichia coli TaxID=562 RepID=UPI0035BE919F